MFTELESERLRLKCIGQEDAEFFYREFSDGEVSRYLFDAEPCSGIEQAREWIDFYLQDEPRGHHRWILVRKADGERIGTCGFHRWDRDEATVEVGYDLLPAYWRNGYMTEALRTILRFAEEEMKVSRVYAHISVDNLASVRTAENLGFHRTGRQYYEELHGEKYLHDIYCRGEE